MNNTLGDDVIEAISTHIFHDPLVGENCGSNPDRDLIPDRCAYVHRKPEIVDSDIVIKTNGEGHNETIFERAFNEVVGEHIFDGVDA